MRKSRFTASQMLAILKEGESGLPVAKVSGKHGIGNATYYQWKSKYGGMSLPELKRVKALETENALLKHLYADLALENAAHGRCLAERLQRRAAARVTGQRAAGGVFAQSFFNPKPLISNGRLDWEVYGWPRPLAWAA